MKKPDKPTIEDVKTALRLVENNDVVNILLEGDADKYFAVPKDKRFAAIQEFSDMSDIVYHYLDIESILGKGKEPVIKSWKISDMFHHHIWSQYSLSEAILTLLNKEKRDKEYMDDFMKQFAHDMKEIHNFVVKITEGEFLDHIQLYNSKKLRTYTAYLEGKFYSKIKVTD